MSNSDESVVMPEHYEILAQKLKKVTWTIQSAFVYRPVPDGIPLDDLEATLSPLFTRAERAAESIGAALNSIPGCQPIAEGPVSEQEIDRAVARWRHPEKGLLAATHFSACQFQREDLLQTASRSKSSVS